MNFSSEEEYKEAQLNALRQLRELFSSGETLSSTVTPVTDYRQDDRICLTAVAFVGNHFEKNAEYNELVQALRQLEPWQYLYPPESLHITIQNVRTIANPPKFDETVIKTSISVFDQVVPKHEAVNFEVENYLLTPSSAAMVALASSSILSLTSSLRTAMLNANIPDDKEYISENVVFGNITFCRYTRVPSKEFVDLITSCKKLTIKNIKVNEISLISTNSICYIPKTKVHKSFQLSTPK